jgi:hypothetical protein
MPCGNHARRVAHKNPPLRRVSDPFSRRNLVDNSPANWCSHDFLPTKISDVPIFFGAGHPDDPSSNPNHCGVAPLRGTDRTKRLMYSANVTDSRLTVKAEWERAEEWLKIKLDNPNQ